MVKKTQGIINQLKRCLIRIVSETNGISLQDTLEICQYSQLVKENRTLYKNIVEFRHLLSAFQQDEAEIETLINHPVSNAFYELFKEFPLPYQEEHIHLTGSLTAEFIYPRLKKLLKGPNKKIYEQKIIDTYGPDALPITSVEDVDELIRLKPEERFEKYLKILLLPKLILTDKKAHEEAAYHMAQELYTKYNIGSIRLKFTFSRSSAKDEDVIPGHEKVTSEDVVLGLYKGFNQFQEENPNFKYILSPSFRKESHFYDPTKAKNKKEYFLQQVDEILDLIDKHPFLEGKLCDVDTVGDEKHLYRKNHFEEMRLGFRKLQFRGLQIRSHHGETWLTLKKGVQAVDNSMNIWHINALEHGLSLGINPNYYFHMLFENVMEKNSKSIPLKPSSNAYQEIMDMEWGRHEDIRDKLLMGEKLTRLEINCFIKIKFHTAREIEHYQHDILNRMIHKKVALIALPSSNLKLTSLFPDVKDHPFSWWEKKGVLLGVGTDNYITLNTDFVREMLILLYTDPVNLKITKLLMVVTGEKRRPFISSLLWEMRDDEGKQLD
jgi:adenosine deaminase